MVELETQGAEARRPEHQVPRPLPTARPGPELEPGQPVDRVAGTQEPPKYAIRETKKLPPLVE